MKRDVVLVRNDTQYEDIWHIVLEKEDWGPSTSLCVTGSIETSKETKEGNIHRVMEDIKDRDGSRMCERCVDYCSF